MIQGKCFKALVFIAHIIILILETSPAVVMADNKKLTTAEILALARQQDSGGATDMGSAPESSAASQSPVPAEDKKPATAPKSTADILAAARAQGGGDQGGSAEKPKPATAPGSTSDILAAARAQGGGAAKSKPAATPKSTADILAAARAGGGNASKASPVASQPKAKKPEAAPVGDRPALKDMVAAVKEAQVSGGPAKPKLPAGKPAPVKPKFPSKKEKIGRRSFGALVAVLVLSPFVIAWSSMSAIAAVWSLGIARFMMPNMVLELPSRFKVGPPSDFPPGSVSAKFKAARGIWIVNTDEYDGQGVIVALASVCTHLGCTPNWLEGEQKFKCPCHGSGFYITGVNFEGPAPRPLERVGISVADDGMLEVDKSVKFQEELGQWSDSKSYEVA